MRIVMVIHAISVGGAERMLTIMANYWVASGREAHIICLGEVETPFFPLDDRVTTQYLRCKKPSANPFAAVFNNVYRLWAIRQAILTARPAVVISFIDKMNILTLISTVGVKVPVVACERTFPRGRPIGWTWEFLRNILYPRAASVVTLTQSGLECFSEKIQLRGRVFPNPITIPDAYRSRSVVKQETAVRKVVVAIGRMNRVKGFDLLIAAFVPLVEKHSEWCLEIWGEGEERTGLLEMVNQLGLSDRIGLPGATRNPFEKFCAADLFVLSSRTEGFPGALCEAMACGLPVVSFDCKSGPSEVIRDGVDGVLVEPENVGELTRAMDRLMGNAELRRQLARRAPEVLERFSVDTVMKSWDEFIASLV